MTLAPRLALRQSQSLVMTPQLQQAIKLLALSNLELESFVAEELDRNPLLQAGEEGERVTALSEAESPPEPATSDTLMQAGDASADAPIDFDAGTAFDDGPNDGTLSLNGATSGDAIDLDGIAADSGSLQDHLRAQAGEALSDGDLALAERIIDLIDEAGYLTATALDVALACNVPLARVEAVIRVLHRFDPTGVGARSLSECLMLQAKERDRHDPCMAALLANLDLLAAGNLPRLKRICAVDDEDLADMIRELREYDPKPGLRFGAALAPAIAPDVFVTRTGKGWAIEVNGATLPRVLVNRRYQAELAAGARDKASRAWLAEHAASANWLVKALDQRQRTIVKVAAELVKQQEGFFLHGVSRLKPLTLRAVADAIEMHESTVSRVTSNKYLSCARGLFELKYFFTSAIQAADGGDSVSAEAVKSQLKALIAAERPRAILSDDALAALLKERGFDIARRTVVKYREAMGIGSSVQRRRQKALEAVG